MKKILHGFIYLCIAAFALTSCKKDDPINQNELPPGKYVIQTASSKWGSGFYNSYLTLPNTDISNINSHSMQVSEVFGTRSFGSWVFDRMNSAGETGLQKYRLNAEKELTEAGFIPDAGNYVIVDATLGYYFDANRGLLKLQIFNPTTMLRTGEIDLSSLAAPDEDDVEYQSIGQHILAHKEGKLFASINYGTTLGGGYADDLYNEVEFAVVDIATNTLDKTITYSGVKGMGWGSSANKFWTKGDDGALYFYSPGFSNGITKSTIIRINAGSTDFDNWSIEADDYQVGSTFGNALVKGGKLYTQFSNTQLISDYSNLDDYIFEYYSIDLITKERTKISGIPLNHYVHANEQGITEIDGKIYFAVMTKSERGYYVLNEDNVSAKNAFRITDGGFIWGLLKLD